MGEADGTSCGTGMVCVSGACVAGSGTCGNGIVEPGEQCDDGNETAFDGCEPTTCVLTCTDDAQCDDSIQCNGAESCTPCEGETCASGRRCASGAPLADATPCERGDDGTGVCRLAVCVPPRCGDGVVDAGEHCDDGNTTAGDGCEIDCRFSCEVDSSVENTWYLDCDGDGFAAAGATPRVQCLEPAPDACGGGWTLRRPVSGATDCDDADAAVHPGAAEVCDGIDNDCVGGVDDSCTAIPCTDGSECASGFCADGVCCDAACDGQCEACDVMPGTCTQVTGAPRGERAACAGSGTLCGGTCGGSRTQCDYPSVSCRAQSCSGAILTHSAICDGAGACPAPALDSCEPYACNSTGTSCRVTCSSDADCSAGNYCNAGHCLGTKPRGYTCGAPSECTSGYCTDGYCCDSACNGQCERCNVAGSPGICSATSGAPVGGRPACTSISGGCGGSCNGVNRSSCTYPSGNSCHYCGSSGVIIGSETPYAYTGGTCNGAGECTGGTTTFCSGYYACRTLFIIGGGSNSYCATSCATDSDCRPDNFLYDYYCRTSDHTCQRR